MKVTEHKTLAQPILISEVWKTIPGYEEKLEASSLGRIRSVPRTVIRKNNNPLRVRGKIRKQVLVHKRGNWDKGYFFIGLHQKALAVHLLVLKAFQGLPSSPEMRCRHLDGNSHNNKAANLTWGTSKENSEDSRRHGTLRPPTPRPGEANNKTKLTTKQVLKIRYLRSTGKWTLKKLSVRFGVSIAAIYSIVANRTWRHI